MTSSTVSKQAECQCATWPNEVVAEKRGRCLIVCGEPINRNWVICRPCAKGNHTGQPCRTPTRDSYFPIEKSCGRCGFDLARHREEDFR